jgi:hypothetical protein
MRHRDFDDESFEAFTGRGTRVGAPLARGGDLARPEVTGAATDPADWITAQVAAAGARMTGPIEEVHRRPWSTVLRVPTDRGPVFFKASSPALGREPAITAFLARRRPDVVPTPLAVDAERGWMLMADAGARLRELVEHEGDVTRWLDVLPRYAAMQLGMADDVVELLALGVPDMRLAVLPKRYEALLDELAAADGDARDGPEGREEEMRRLRDAVPRVAAKCAELAGYGIAETIQHDDLHDGAVYVRDGRYAILDWGDACVSHPFFSMSVTLEGVISWGREDVQNSVDTGPYRDAYLAPFAAGRDMSGLREAFGLALRLGWVCRAVNAHPPGVDPGLTWTRLRMFLDGHP